MLPLNVGTFISFLVMFSMAYYLLLQDNFMHLSIASIISRSHPLELKKHLIVLGLLPVYIATIIFGSAVASVHLGSTVQYFLNKTCKS